MTKTELKNMMKVRSSVKHLSLLILKMSFKTLREGFKKKKKCGIFCTFENPPTPIAKCGKKIKETWSKNHF